MTYVSAHEGENIESLLRRFKMSVAKSGVLRDLKDHRFFRSKAEKARVAAQRAARRNRRTSSAR